MTTNEITQVARNKVLEITDGIISDATVLLYTNLSYQDVWKRVFTSNEVITESVACNNGVCALPAMYGRSYTAAKDNNDRFHNEMSIADFHRLDVDRGYTVENNQLLVKDDQVTALEVKYYPQPEQLSSTVNPSIDSFFHESILDGVVYRLHEELQDEELATFYKEKFKNDLNERIAHQSSYEETNQTGGEMFIPQSLI